MATNDQNVDLLAPTDDGADNAAPQDDATLNDALSEPEGAFISGEPRKKLSFGTIVMIGMLLAGGAVIYCMKMRTGPQSAAAAEAPEAVAANKTITAFLSKGAENRVAMEKLLLDTQKVVQQFVNYPSMTQIPLSDLKINPFRYTSQAPVSTGPDAEAVEKKKREAERVAALQAVQKLQLQSIMHGDARRACMINNTLFQEGQTVETFLIEKISPNSVIVKSGTYRFELKMQK